MLWRTEEAAPARSCFLRNQDSSDKLPSTTHHHLGPLPPILQKHISSPGVLQAVFLTLTSRACIVSSTAIIRDVGRQHESIRRVVTHCPLLPHISPLLSTLLHRPNPKGSTLANHNPAAFPATATGPLRSPACNLRSCSSTTLAEIRGHSTPALCSLPHMLLY